MSTYLMLEGTWQCEHWAGKKKKNWRSLHKTFYYLFILTDILVKFAIAHKKYI
jgi:hypothetical protein